MVNMIIELLIASSIVVDVQVKVARSNIVFNQKLRLIKDFKSRMCVTNLSEIEHGFLTD